MQTQDTKQPEDGNAILEVNDVLVPSPFVTSANDYDHISKAMDLLSMDWQRQPSLEDIADHVGLSPTHFQKLFVRWAGISPKEFVRAVTLDHARGLLRAGASILDTAYESGLSGPGRLHDLFVQFEAMTPGDFKSGGRELVISYGFHPSPFGTALAMATDRGLAGLAFANSPDEQQAVFDDMKQRWPMAQYREAPEVTGPYIAKAFDPSQWQSTQPLKIVLMGSPLDVTVWQALLKIPRKAAVTYGALAHHIGKPKAARAVGSAVGRNPISFVVPCHRVMRKSGALGGYHWGLSRKCAIIGWENALG